VKDFLDIKEEGWGNSSGIKGGRTLDQTLLWFL